MDFKNAISRRQFIKSSGTSLLTILGLQFLTQMPTSSGTANQRIPILLYHRVGYTKGSLTVTPERFANDLKLLKEQGYHTINLEQFTAFVYDKEVELPANPILITFDDGYLDNYENAYPLLQKNEMTACFYIISGMIGNKDRVTESNIRDMHSSGMSIGSHTVNHKALDVLSLTRQKKELAESKYTLEDILGQPVEGISYPRGCYNLDTIQLSKEIGYNSGVTTVNGCCSKLSNPFALKRVAVFSFDGDIKYVLKKV